MRDGREKVIWNPFTEALIRNTQEQSIQTDYIKCNIDKTGESSLCRMYGTRNETISYRVSECGKFAQNKYKQRHDNVEKLGFNRVRLWYEHEAESVDENENFIILWVSPYSVITW